MRPYCGIMIYRPTLGPVRINLIEEGITMDGYNNEQEYLERGSLDDRYQIYLGCLEGTGQPVKDYDEWLQS